MALTVMTDEQAKEYWRKHTERLERIKTMEMLLGARWSEPSLGMPGYYRRATATITEATTTIVFHEEFYNENGDQIENPWGKHYNEEGHEVENPWLTGIKKHGQA